MAGNHLRLIKQAINYIRNGNYEKALILLQRILASVERNQHGG